MPYVNDTIRVALDDKINQLVDRMGERIKKDEIEGALNYAMTELMVGAYQQYDDGIRYKTLNSMLGVLACMQQEIYRRLGAWYEDVAIDKNGDINAFDMWGHWK